MRNIQQFQAASTVQGRSPCTRTDSKPFRWEADMTPMVESSIGQLWQGTMPPDLILREAQGAIGIIDLVSVAFNHPALDHRLRECLGPVTLPLRVQVLDALGRRRPMRVETLARRLGRNPRALLRSTLQPLQELGAVELGADRVVASGAWAPVAAQTVAIELKLSKWRSALRQADNAAMSADKAWVVLDKARAGGALLAQDYFRASGIGLAVVNSTGGLELIVRAGRRRVVRWLHAWLGELAWAGADKQIESRSSAQMFPASSL
jgi:hypothetical protein